MATESIASRLQDRLGAAAAPAALRDRAGPFKAAYKGQMELYLRWLDKRERQPGEEPPLSISLCAGGKRGQIELLERGAAGIHVAQYLTALPPRELLAQRVQQAAAHARQQLEHRSSPSSPNDLS